MRKAIPAVLALVAGMMMPLAASATDSTASPSTT